MGERYRSPHLPTKPTKLHTKNRGSVHDLREFSLQQRKARQQDIPTAREMVRALPNVDMRPPGFPPKLLKEWGEEPPQFPTRRD